MVLEYVTMAMFFPIEKKTPIDLVFFMSFPMKCYRVSFRHSRLAFLKAGSLGESRSSLIQSPK